MYKKYSILFYRINNIIFISLLLIVQCNKEHNLDIINNNQACFYCLYKYNTGIIRICVMRRQIGREKEPMHILLRLFPSILFTEYNSIAFTSNSRVIHHLFLWNTNTNRFLIWRILILFIDADRSIGEYSDCSKNKHVVVRSKKLPIVHTRFELQMRRMFRLQMYLLAIYLCAAIQMADAETMLTSPASKCASVENIYCFVYCRFFDIGPTVDVIMTKKKFSLKLFI